MGTPRRQVALLVHTASDWTREVLRGVSTYLRDKSAPWNVFLESRGFHERLALPERFHVDGVILRMTHVELEAAVREQGLPAVNVSWLGSHSPQIPKVVSDETGCAELGVRHLREKGYRHIGYVGPSPALSYSDTIQRVCEQRTVAEFHRFPNEQLGTSDDVTRWLQSIPKPIGIVAWNATASKRVLDACLELQLHVPHDVGIVCIEHDHLIAAMSRTPLTSIDQDPVSVGFEAARLLDSLMDGKAGPEEPRLIYPHGIICRQSTETSTTDDKVVETALHYIRENFSRPIRVDDICARVEVSRRQLEHRFRAAIDSTPANEIRRARLANVRRLLVETPWCIDRIAVMSGYDHPEVMTRAFKQSFGRTPGEYRKSQ